MAKQSRKVSDTDRAFYKLGLQDGRRQLERTIILLKTTNRTLWDELCRLDREDPIAGVIMSRVLAKEIIKALRKPTKNHSKLAGTLEKLCF